MGGVNSVASFIILAVGLVAAAAVGFGLTPMAPVGSPQFELQVDEGIGAFDRLPVWRAALHRL